MPSITITGVDERTNIDALKSLNAEIGFLYTVTPEGRNRYPSRDWIKVNAGKCRRAALHICGSKAREELIRGELRELLFGVQRIQINGTVTLAECEEICAKFPHKCVITQHRVENHPLLLVKARNHELLVDKSGGRGLSPDKWVRPDTTKEVGFAGGLGPDNLAQELARIQSVARGEWWVDMEAKLRKDDWFDVDLAKQVVAIFNAADFFGPISAARYERALMDVAHRKLAKHPHIQAEVIARHYLQHAGIARNILNLLELQKGQGDFSPEMDRCIQDLVKEIKNNHRMTFGIALEWPTQPTGDMEREEQDRLQHQEPMALAALPPMKRPSA